MNFLNNFFQAIQGSTRRSTVVALLSSSLLMGKLSFAETSWVEHVVKVESYPCHLGGREYRKEGSGILFSHEGKIFVLTSDHVVFHGFREQGICHEVSKMDWGSSAELVNAHVGRGVAILEVTSLVPPLANVFTAEKLLNSDVMPEVGLQVELVGYPHGVSAMNSFQGRVSAHSRRHILPLITEVIEVDARNEYGMSGGALLSHSQQGFYMGILSHQYVQLHEGNPSTIGEHGPGDTGQVLVGLVIPIKEISDWINITLSGRFREESLMLDLNGQMAGEDRIDIEGVRFEPVECEETLGSATRDSGFIAAPWTIFPAVPMGGDGVGVGGTGRFYRSRICKTKLSWNSLDAHQNIKWPFEDSERRVWFDRLKYLLQGRGVAYMDGFLLRDKGVEQMETLIGNINETLNFFARDTIPLTRLTPNPSDSIERDLQKELEAAIPSFNEIDFGKWKESPDFQQILFLKNNLLIFFKKLEYHQYLFVTAESMKTLLESEAWGPLYTDPDSYNHVTALKTCLYKIDALLRRLRL